MLGWLKKFCWHDWETVYYHQRDENKPCFLLSITAARYCKKCKKLETSHKNIGRYIHQYELYKIRVHRNPIYGESMYGRYGYWLVVEEEKCKRCGLIKDTSHRTENLERYLLDYREQMIPIYYV